eukprot:12297178-Ditylum_brightwellii.AAC.1
MQEAYTRGIHKKNTQEEYTRGIHKKSTQEGDTRGRHNGESTKAPIGNEQRRQIPSNRYVRTPTACTTIQPTASPPRDVHIRTRNPHEIKPPEELCKMTAGKTT